MKMFLMSNNVLVRLDEFPDHPVDGGKIFQPDIAQERPYWGEVMAVGPGHYTRKGKYIPTQLNIGDKVCLPWAEGNELKIKERIFMIVPETTIMAVAT